MNHLGLKHVLILSLIASTAGCVLDDKCVADCDTMGANDSGSSSEGDPSGDSTSNGVPGTCESNTEAASAFIEANRQCQSVLDCFMVDSICYQGPLNGPCGAVGISADADLEQWNELHDALSGCECGAAACGSSLMCTDEGLCDAVLFSDDQCASYDRDVESFLDQNRACETDADCQLAPALCYGGPEAACGTIALNTAADLEDWELLDGYLGLCVESCGADPCGASVSCGPEGLCVAAFP